ncbi:MAG: AraC family transcriptional regulator [Pseudomonadota bacterium]
MKPLQLEEAEISKLLFDASAAGGEQGASMALPHGAGRLLWEEFNLDQGVKVTVSQGWLDKPVAVMGKDSCGLEIGFQLGTSRRVSIGDQEIVDDPQPLYSIYKSAGGQDFEIVEQPTRDAAFVEFSFEPGAVERLCPVLDHSLNALLARGLDVGNALLFKRPLPPSMAEAARRLARPYGGEGSRALAAKRDAFALLGLLTNECFDGEPLSDAGRARQAAEILRSELANPPDLGALAKAVGSKPHRLSAAFRAEFDMTPSMFVRSERMQRASERLRGGQVHIASLAWELGYRSTSHFVQAFRDWHGVTPARFGRMGAGSKNDILSD